MKKCVKNETVKVILSIDCAATTCNSEIDIDDAIKFSGMKRKEYIGQKELVEKLCDLGKKLTLDEICAQLELNDLIKMDAAHLLQQYAKTKLLSDEITNAQYLAMAIYQSCQKRKYKTSNIKSKLIQISRLSTKMWKYMEQEWTNWIEENPSLHKNLKTSNEQTEEKGKTNNIKSLLVCFLIFVWHFQVVFYRRTNQMATKISFKSNPKFSHMKNGVNP